MANILIITDRIPWPLQDGGNLRVINLAGQIAQSHDCRLLIIGESDSNISEVLGLNLFSSVNFINIDRGNPSIRRHFRLSDDNFIKLSWPDQFETIIARINSFVENHHIEIVLGMNVYVAEYFEGIAGVRKILDDCDCRTLYFEREYRPGIKPGEIIKYHIDVRRIRNQERGLGKVFDLVTTISPIDKARLIQLCGDTNIEVIPNGVSDALLNYQCAAGEIPDSIAFWGNLAFPPNRAAIEYFCEKIYLPHIQPRGIKWYVIGKEPGTLLKERAARYDSIVLTGFVEDLYKSVCALPVMINPMISGGGQKNKVLEAFMLARGVVSTSLGVESFPVKNGVHCLISDTPESFAESVITLLEDPAGRAAMGLAARKLVLDNYTWDKAGQIINASINRVLSLP